MVPSCYATTAEKGIGEGLELGLGSGGRTGWAARLLFTQRKGH